MAIRFTQEQFLFKARNIHGNKYDYSKVEYINNRSKVIIICKNHGEFSQKAVSHLAGKGCSLCASQKCAIIAQEKALSLSEFIEKSREKHGDKFDYSMVEYKNTKQNIKIICPIHGLFEQRAGAHLSGSGCLDCKKAKSTKTIDDFIPEFNIVHKNKYNYEQSIYVNNRTKIKIICPDHGEFYCTPAHHREGRSCKECMKSKFKTKDHILIDSFNKVHNYRYNYDKVEYKNQREKIIVICPVHGDFECISTNHLKGSGCPKCNFSKGECEIKNILSKYGLNYIAEKRFSTCVSAKGKQLRFDFYLPEFDILVEYQGIQHYEPVAYFKNLEKGSKHN